MLLQLLVGLPLEMAEPGWKGTARFVSFHKYDCHDICTIAQLQTAQGVACLHIRSAARVIGGHSSKPTFQLTSGSSSSSSLVNNIDPFPPSSATIH